LVVVRGAVGLVAGGWVVAGGAVVGCDGPFEGDS
jgi:hypothetical protein